MALETGENINNLVPANPPAGDPVAQGDNHLRLIKKVLQQSLPSVNQGSNPVIASATAPSLIIADDAAFAGSKGSQGLIWFDTTTSTLKINKSTSAVADWVTLADSPVTDNSVDVNAGTIDGAVVGGTTPAAVTGTTLKADTSLELATGATVTGVDNATLATGSATLLATQGAIKTYVDAQITAEDLDVTSDSGTIDIDLDGDTLSLLGESTVLDTSAVGTTVTFNVSTNGITNAKLAAMAANTVKVRDSSSAGNVSDKAVGDTEVLIGDGDGFTAAALSGDVTMTNAGAVNVAKIQGEAVSATSAANDQYLKYSSASSEWQKVDVLAPDRLTTKGDLLVYNTVDSETRLPVGINDLVLTADSTATNGVAWKTGGDAVGTAAAMAIALG
jgi:hypothetical protein|tara:strand:- start:56 stop:1222 length:1167 start_codon:yes stop_codon:yes gene_type:complete